MQSDSSEQLSRLDRICQHLDLTGHGLEIGPSYNPVVSKKVTPSVETVDHAPREVLVEKYVGYGLAAEQIDRIEEVDYIWTGGSLLDAIPRRGWYDYIIASHFIEHTVDLTQFLADCEALLKPDGVLSLAVPDKRFTFDRFRPLTSLGDVIDAKHAAGPFHPPGALVDHAAYASVINGQVAWHDGTQGPLRLQSADLSGVPAAESSGASQAEYVDVHRWIFTPQSFLLLMDDLRELGHHRFEVVDLHVDGTHEFLASLRKTTTGAQHGRDRLAALLALEEESAYTTVRDLTQRLRRRTRQVERLKERNRELERQLRMIKSSRSWKVAGALRKGASIARLRRV